MRIETADFLFAENPNPMWIYDPTDLSIKQVNEAACDMYGYSREEFLALTIADLRPESEIPKLEEEVSKQVDRFNNAGIWKHHKKNGDLLFVRVLSHPVSQEGSQYKLVTAQDVTDKIQYRQELDMLLENSLDGIMIASPDGRIHKANKAACQILGMTEKQITNLGREGLVHKDEKLQEALKIRKQTGKFSGELTFIHNSGRKIPVELTTSVYKNLQGQLRTSLIFRDISERKETQKKLQDIVNYSTNLFYRHDINHVLTYVSPQSEEFLGCSPEEAKQKWMEFITDHPINQKGEKNTEKAIETGEKSPPYQLQLQKKTGEKIWVRVNEAPIVEDGETVAIVGSLTDITRQKEYEQQLQENLERYHYATKATNDAIYDWDIANDHIHMGEGFSNIFGHDIEKKIILLEEYNRFIHPGDRTGIEQSLDRTLKDSSLNHWNCEYRFKKSDGEYAHVVENGYIIRDEDGTAIRMIGAVRDVTKQKELERLLDQAHTMGRIGVWELDLKNDELYWSAITKEIHEVEPDFNPELEKALNFYKEGKSREIIQEAVTKAIEEGIPWDEELQIITAEGNERWVRSKGESEIVEGQCQRIYGIFQDIHERKVAQTKMVEALEERQRILERISEAFFAVDEEWTVTYWNNKAEEVLGFSRTEVLGNNLWEKFPEAKDLKFFQEYHRAFEQQVPVSFEEYYPPVGVWFEVHGYPSSDGLSVFFRDITERKEAAQSLRELYQKNRQILESTSEGIYGIDTEGRCTFINKAAANMLGYHSEECLGKNMHKLIHYKHSNGEPYPESKCPIFISKNKHESCRITDEVFWRADGTCFDVEYSSNPVIEDGEIKGAVVAFSDITERKQHQRELRESLKEQETLLSEIHHRVKNNLAVVSSMMQLQAFEEEDKSLKQKLNDGVSRIKTMGNIHELLYKSDSFSKLNIDENIKKLVDDITHAYQHESTLEINFDLQQIDLNINQAIPTSLIVNEVVTNVFKHAFDEEERGKLWVTLTETNNTVSLQITDDGKGFPADFKVTDNAGSLGLKLIDTLAQQLKGDYKYESADGKTHFKLRFKKVDIKGSGSTLLDDEL